MKNILLFLVAFAIIGVACQQNNDIEKANQQKNVVNNQQQIDTNEDYSTLTLGDQYRTFFEEGKALLESGNAQKSIGYFKREIQDNPKADCAWGDLGRAQKELKDYENAVISFSKAIELNNQRSVYFDWRSRTYQELGKNDLALKDRKMAENLHAKGFD